jgi:pimeloyl-ACP methyl ester carboxylesterase
LTLENLTADADALREELGFEQWAVLGHSFGGHFALECELRYPARVSRLVLLDTATTCVVRGERGRHTRRPWVRRRLPLPA